MKITINFETSKNMQMQCRLNSLPPSSFYFQPTRDLLSSMLITDMMYFSISQYLITFDKEQKCLISLPLSPMNKISILPYDDQVIFVF